MQFLTYRSCLISMQAFEKIGLQTLKMVGLSVWFFAAHIVVYHWAREKFHFDTKLNSHIASHSTLDINHGITTKVDINECNFQFLINQRSSVLTKCYNLSSIWVQVAHNYLPKKCPLIYIRRLDYNLLFYIHQMSFNERFIGTYFRRSICCHFPFYNTAPLCNL